jgi:hypothetical protein
MTTVKVSFAEDAIVHEIERVDDLSAQEIENIWFTKNDFREIRFRDAAIVIQIVRQTVQEDDDNHCIRGLEGRTPIASDHKKLKFIETIYVVLDEQERQFASGVSNPNKIASLYRKSTKACAKAAKHQGRTDWQSINDNHIVLAIEEEEEQVPVTTLIVDAEEQMSKKKQQGPKNRIQRFLGRASSQPHDLVGANQKRIWGRASSQPHDMVGANQQRI